MEVPSLKIKTLEEILEERKRKAAEGRSKPESAADTSTVAGGAEAGGNSSDGGGTGALPGSDTGETILANETESVAGEQEHQRAAKRGRFSGKAAAVASGMARAAFASAAAATSAALSKIPPKVPSKASGARGDPLAVAAESDALYDSREHGSSNGTPTTASSPPRSSPPSPSRLDTHHETHHDKHSNARVAELTLRTRGGRKQPREEPREPRPLQPLPHIEYPDGDIPFAPERSIFLRETHEVSISVEAVEGELPRQRGWEIMQHVQNLIPRDFKAELSLRSENAKVVKMLAHVSSREHVQALGTLLSDHTIKLSQSSTRGRISASSLRPGLQDVWRDCFPRHFDDSPPGHRPDTLLISGLPLRWFALEGSKHEVDLPLVQRALSRFGPVTHCERHAQDSSSKGARSSSSPLLLFAVVVQYSTYHAFVAAVAAMHARRLVMQQPERVLQADLTVTVDTSGFFSDESIRRRRRDQQEKELRERQAAERVRREQEEARLQQQREEERARLQRLKEEEEARKRKEREEQRKREAALEEERRQLAKLEEERKRAAEEAERLRLEQLQREEERRREEEEMVRRAAEEERRRHEAFMRAKRDMLNKKRELAAAAAEKRKQSVVTTSTPSSGAGAVLSDTEGLSFADEQVNRDRDQRDHALNSIANGAAATTATAGSVRMETDAPSRAPAAGASAGVEAAADSALRTSNRNPSSEIPPATGSGLPATRRSQDAHAGGAGAGPVVDEEMRERVEAELRAKIIKKIRYLEDKRKTLLREKALEDRRQGDE